MTSLENEPSALPDSPPDNQRKRPRKRKTTADIEADTAQQLASPMNTAVSSAISSTTHDEASTPQEPFFQPSVAQAEMQSTKFQSTEIEIKAIESTAIESTVEPSVTPNQPQEEVFAAENTIPSQALGCGCQLKAAREALGLSIHEVCSQLRLGAHQIQAIEQDDFAALPQKSIVRGFIRNYARLLKIDATPILLAYQQLIPNEAPANITVKASAYTTVINTADNPINLKNGLALLLIALIFGLLAYFYIYHVQPTAAIEIPTTLSVGPETTVDPSIANQSDASLNNANVSTATEMPAMDNLSPTATIPPENPNNPAEAAPLPTAATPTTPVVEGTTTSTASPTVTAGNAPTPALASVAPVVSQPTSAKPTTPYTTTAITPTPAANTIAMASTFKANDPKKTDLSFVVSEESWVRIEDAQGNKILSELLKPGPAKIVSVEKPLSITVGHANATQLLIDQQPYDLAQATRGRVARVQLK